MPSEDEHQSEEIGESDERRSWISGCVSDCFDSNLGSPNANLSFTGSAGTALIPSSNAAAALLFVDSRYWIQAGKQVTTDWEVRRVGSRSSSGKDDVVGGWIDAIVDVGDSTSNGAKLTNRTCPKAHASGSTPSLLLQVRQIPTIRPCSSSGSIKAIEYRLSSSSTRLVPLSKNLIDLIRPYPPRSEAPILPHPLKYAGNTTATKLTKIREVLNRRAKNGWIYVLPTLPAIAWTLNIRCGDIPYCPVAYAYLVFTQDKCAVFVDSKKVDVELRTIWNKDDIEIRGYGVDEVGKYVKNQLKAIQEGNEKKKVRVFAPKECSWALSEACAPVGLSTGRRKLLNVQSEVEILQPCPVDIIKGVKNGTEIEGARKAYLRDGRAMVRWMAWLEQKILQDGRPVGEWVAAQGLLRYRKLEENFA